MILFNCRHCEKLCPLARWSSQKELLSHHDSLNCLGSYYSGSGSFMTLCWKSCFKINSIGSPKGVYLCLVGKFLWTLYSCVCCMVFVVWSGVIGALLVVLGPLNAMLRLVCTILASMTPSLVTFLLRVQYLLLSFDVFWVVVFFLEVLISPLSMRDFSSIIPFSTRSANEVQHCICNSCFKFELRFSINMKFFCFSSISIGHLLAKPLDHWKKVKKFSPSSCVVWHRVEIVISLSMFNAKCSINLFAKSPYVLMPVGRCANHSSACPTRLNENSLIRHVGSYVMSKQSIENSLTCSIRFPFPMYLGKLGMM